MKNNLKRLFKFICFFVILPIATFVSIAIVGEVIFQYSSFGNLLYGLLMFFISWAWLILAYKYLIKLFD